MLKKPVLLMIYVLALTLASTAQFQSKLAGVVKDQQGNPVEKATVTVVSTRTTSLNYQLSTNKEGKFVQVGVMPGYYQVNVSKNGYITRSTEVHVGVDDQIGIEITLQTMTEVVEKNVSSADKLFLQGNALYGEQKFAEAVKAYEDAIQTDQTNWCYFFNLGLAYKKMDNREQALKAFRKAAELNPGSYSSNKETGEILALGGSFEEAKGFYRKAVELSPNDPDARFNLGACLTNTGENEEAAIQFQKAIELKPDYADAYYQLGTLFIGQNNVPGAVQNLEKFLSLAPNHEKAPLAKQLLDYLKK